ncbi:MAG: TMEM175 family protein [Bacteroidota bacterium]|nr:TMEM175 family protein [Bacteroidota bacterium]MDP4236215.1 TMEM175 family protein [Bacteroidota bacterium]
MNSRLETFCDGVFAIALTLLVLEIKTPAVDNIHSSDDLWHALSHLLPSVFAFLLSFTIIVISWVNHHALMKLINKSTAPFIYANVFLLLTVVILPFPTALFAEFGFTDAATPAVVLYSFVMLLTNIGWILIARTALKPVLAKSDEAEATIRQILKQGKSAFILYSVCTILAFWFPLIISIILTLTWMVWLVLGLNYKDEKV